MKKIILSIFVLCFSVLCAGCSRSSVDDAVAMDASRSEKNEKNMEEATTKENVSHSQKSWVSGKKVNIIEAGKGETILYGGYELTVIESWITGDTLMPLDEITGSPQFRKYLIGELDYDETGKYLGKLNNVKNVFVKVKIKNVSAKKDNENLLIDPLLFVQTSAGSYNKILAEAIGFDKCKYISSSNNQSKDGKYYTFKQGEEIETVIAIMLNGDYSEKDDIYMYSGFLDLLSGDGVNSVGDGSYMIKLDCVAK